MLANKPKTKILVDGGDPEETLRVKDLMGFVDGQTTNPSLIAKNPEIQERIAAGHTLSPQEEKDEYRKIVQAISPLVGDAGVSIEVFADMDTKAEEMLAQGEEMFSWIPNAYIKYPCTREGTWIGKCFRFPRFCTCIYPPFILRRKGTIPLGRSEWRPGGYSCNR